MSNLRQLRAHAKAMRALITPEARAKAGQGIKAAHERRKAAYLAALDVCRKVANGEDAREQAIELMKQEGLK